MTKELEALDFIKNTIEEIQYYNRSVKIDNSIYDLFDTIETAIKHLEEYDSLLKEYDIKLSEIREAFIFYKMKQNSNPSEALKIVDKMANYILLDEEYGFIDDEEKQEIIKDRDTIKQALLKAQEQEKVLEIIFEKNVDIIRIRHLIFKSQKNPKYWDLKYYNDVRVIDDEKLTQEEFELLKRWLENES